MDASQVDTVKFKELYLKVDLVELQRQKNIDIANMKKEVRRMFREIENKYGNSFKLRGWYERSIINAHQLAQHYLLINYKEVQKEVLRLDSEISL